MEKTRRQMQKTVVSPLRYGLRGHLDQSPKSKILEIKETVPRIGFKKSLKETAESCWNSEEQKVKKKL